MQAKKSHIQEIEELKTKLGVRCKCHTQQCAKCLTVNCKDDNCPIHTKKLKADFKRRNPHMFQQTVYNQPGYEQNK